jgi:tRNA dimethylallyltransferase
LPVFVIISSLDEIVAGEYPGIVILGPTASGKTRLGIALASQFQGEIVSCDALQVYKHMDIGTAKASPAERNLTVHHMLDLRNPDEDFSAGDYKRLAREALGGIRRRKRLPIVVGGTGFYLRALLEGLFEGPARQEALRLRMRRIIARKGAKILHNALKKIDPQSASRLADNDAERIIRAYEIYLVSGKPMSWWQQQPRDALQGFLWLKIGINVPRELLYQRIDRRVDEMIKGGLLEEVQRLLEQFPRSSFKAIGYRQVAEYLGGKLSLGQAIEDTKKESRHYAKRQLTWFRSEPGVIWLDGQQELKDLEQQSSALVAEFLEKQKPNWIYD